MLVAESLDMSYASPDGSVTVLRHVTVELAAGESASIMGPSGSGKSTLLNILGTLERPTRGRVSLDGCDPFSLTAPDLARFRNERIGFVFQDHHLLPQCSVLENVLLPTLAFRTTIGSRSRDPVDAPPEGDERAIDRGRRLLARVGLEHRLEHRPAQLSGGERQRVAIARALIQRPAVVLADEPTGNLDQRSAEAVADLLWELHRDEQTILIIATHSPTLADRADRRFELQDGKLQECPADNRT